MKSAHVQALAQRLYGIEAEVEPLAAERDLNFRLSTSEGQQYVLKIADPSRTELEISFQIALLEHLAASGLPVQTPYVVPTNLDAALLARISDFAKISIEGEDRLIHLLTFVEGIPLRGAKVRTHELYTQWGQLCGALSKSLSNFDHPGAYRYSRWSPEHVLDSMPLLAYFRAEEEVMLAEYWFAYVRDATLPLLPGLRRSVCYLDAHEDNLLISANLFEARLAGLIDVGDALLAPTVSELAVAAAYAAMDSPDPVGRMAELTRAYHGEFPLSEQEIEALFGLTIARLLITVTGAAEASELDPLNAYRSVSASQAWEVLRKLKKYSPELAQYRLRESCDLEPCPQAIAWRSWLAETPSLQPLFYTKGAKVTHLDLSVGSLSLGHYSHYLTLPPFERRMDTLLTEANAGYGYGGYLESRPFYTTDLFQQEGNDGPRWRSTHLGLDIWAGAGMPVYLPLAGEIIALQLNAGERDYGATIIMRHEVELSIPAEQHQEPLIFYTLYGHLSRKSLTQHTVGTHLEAGSLLAHTGHAADNGGWPPHLHFQVMLDLLDLHGDFPGVCFPEEACVWASLCPDPAGIARFGLFKKAKEAGEPQKLEAYSNETSSIDELMAFRKRKLGHSLSISYQQPLHIVRGVGNYLLDITGRRYLDTVNNVAHVGHEHPSVVEAIQRQAAVLNTNTRYLHEEVLAFAEELCATMPPELSVVHVVNSGSEANELALRMARAASGGRQMVAVEHGYHGNSSATLAVSSYKFDGKGGQGKPGHTQVVPMPDLYRGAYRDEATAGALYAQYIDSVLAAIAERGEKLAGFICESVLSCGGQLVLPKGYLAAAYAKTRAAGGVCIADEVQVGLGRVGSHFCGFQLQEVVPDIVVVGKPIGNGHPLGVVICSEVVADAFAAGGMEYFNTFGGNPVSCAAGRAVLRVIQEEALQQNALHTGQYLLDGLRELQARSRYLGDVRGHGLFLGLDLVTDQDSREPNAKLASFLTNHLRGRGILMSTDGPHHNVLKIKPPMCFGRPEADFLLRELEVLAK